MSSSSLHICEPTRHSGALPGLGLRCSRAAIVEEERLREQEHGLALLYNDWRMFQVMHPEQEALRTKQGPYWYRYPQGENVPDVRERLRSWLGTITRDYRGQSVLAITHHLAILGLRANLERLDAVQFTHLDEQEKPVKLWRHGLSRGLGDR